MSTVTLRSGYQRFVVQVMKHNVKPECAGRSAPRQPQPWTRLSLERAAKPRWTVVLAFYDEVEELSKTLKQLMLQSVPFRMVLVDNGSTDDGVAICHRTLRDSGIEYAVLREAGVFGQTAALAHGLQIVDTEFVATCDAETHYPSTYLRDAELLFDRDQKVVVACAYFHPSGKGIVRSMMAAIHQCGAARVFPRQTHVGAAGQSFRTEVLREAGGYDTRRWPYPLGDHEIMHQVLKHGRQAMMTSHWCSPSKRTVRPMRWSLIERCLYHLVPFPAKDLYFQWLGRRLDRRGLLAARLRERDWGGGSE